MKIAKPLLLILTPAGVVIGVYEAWRLAGALVFLMLALLGILSVAMGTVIVTIRRERAVERALQQKISTGAQLDQN
jgi:hypothetical protein